MSKLMENQVKIAAEEGKISSRIPLAVCVDDEEFNLEILEKHLKMGGFECATFLNGEDALKYITENSKRVDVILLDIMMPGIDGIQVLKELKANEATKTIPVIMQTAVTQEKKNVEGIESGAYYYITKPYSHSVLVSIVKSAIREKIQAEGLQGDVVTVYNIIDSIKSATFEVKTFEAARKLANYLARFSNDPSKFVIGLTSLLINAIEHGNLEIGFDTKAKLLIENTYDEEIEKRIQNPLHKDKKVIVELFKKDKEGIYSVVIKDEGKGFNWEDYFNFDPARMTDPNGRGIAMANIMNPGAIEYWGRGNVVVFKMPMRIAPENSKEI